MKKRIFALSFILLFVLFPYWGSAQDNKLAGKCIDGYANTVPANTWRKINGNFPYKGYERIDVYLTAGMKYVFSLCSEDEGSANFDSYMALYGYGRGNYGFPEEGQLNLLAYNDDYRGNRCSKIIYLASQSGYASLYITGYSDSQYGSYTLAYKYDTLPTVVRCRDENLVYKQVPFTDTVYCDLLQDSSFVIGTTIFNSRVEGFENVKKVKQLGIVPIFKDTLFCQRGWKGKTYREGDTVVIRHFFLKNSLPNPYCDTLMLFLQDSSIIVYSASSLDTAESMPGEAHHNHSLWWLWVLCLIVLVILVHVVYSRNSSKSKKVTGVDVEKEPLYKLRKQVRMMRKEEDAALREIERITDMLVAKEEELEVQSRKLQKELESCKNQLAESDETIRAIKENPQSFKGKIGYEKLTNLIETAEKCDEISKSIAELTRIKKNAELAVLVEKNNKLQQIIAAFQSAPESFKGKKGYENLTKLIEKAEKCDNICNDPNAIDGDTEVGKLIKKAKTFVIILGNPEKLLTASGADKYPLTDTVRKGLLLDKVKKDPELVMREKEFENSNLRAVIDSHSHQ